MHIFKYIYNFLIILAASLLISSCRDDSFANLDYVTIGEEVTINVPISFPQMDVKTRANLEDWQINQVNNVWIATFDAINGNITSKDSEGNLGWFAIDNPKDYNEPQSQKVTINTLSGPSFIVAVANVDNQGFFKSTPNNKTAISALLKEATSWSKFLEIAVDAPSEYEDVNAPHTPLTMVGCYTNKKPGTHDPSKISDPSDISNWQNEDFTPHTIPTSENGVASLTDGAIHLRRLVSQNTFRIIAGENITITPNSYKIVNVPVYSWLYERPANAENGLLANYGDACTKENKDDYYVTTDIYPASSFEQDGNDYVFSFWQAENKHTGTFNIENPNYKDRQEQTHNADGTNTGLFKALIGQDNTDWTSNNMASYVLINLTIDYKKSMSVDENGKPQTGGTDVFRSGNAVLLIHLGYLNKIVSDFNCFRNTKYTYKITVNGLNDILVEAYGTEETPGVEGLVSDVFNPTLNLDSHYHCFNVQLTDEELQAYKTSPDGVSSGFGFIISTYDNLNGGLKRFEESNFVEYENYDKVPEDIQKYVNWIELRKTTAKDVLAKYIPRNGKNGKKYDGLTFNLIDASKGLTKDQFSTDGDINGNWYTVFVNEYTYEADGANETLSATDASGQTKGKPLWQSYVNAEPRRFYIKVTRQVSNDQQSIYARSKYAAIQQSILSYYSSTDPTTPVNGGVKGSAIGIERENESLGKNLRRSFTGQGLGINDNNGRHNTWQFIDQSVTNSKDETDQWNIFLNQTALMDIKSFNFGDIAEPARTEPLPRIANFKGELTGGLISENNMSGDKNDTGYKLLNGKSPFDPQPNSDNLNDYIEAINACMNRNRDNNGDGIIDKSELRWYVPAMGKYLRIIIGNRSLGEFPLMNYNNIQNIKTNVTYYINNGDAINGTSTAGYCGRHLFFSSDGRVLWGGEGFSTSNWAEWGLFDPVAPWQVRCIRNLGTDLSQIYTDDQTIKAYVHTPNGTGGKVEMKYYQLNSIRNTPYSGNGNNNARYMPVHRQSDAVYNSLYTAFEISKGQYPNSGGFRYDYAKKFGEEDLQSTADVINWINENPCSQLDGGNGGWRIPNVKELAIMRSEKYSQGLSDTWQASDFILSCSTNTFNTKGENTTEGTHYFFVARGNAITQLNQEQFNDQAKGGRLFIRCVRDVP